MAADETDNVTKPARPSWETAAPAARPPAPRPAAPRPAALAPSPSAYAPPAAAYTPPPAPVAPALSHYSEPLSDPNVRYDLAGNPIITSTPAPAPYAPPAPYGYSAGTAPAAPGTWPPPLVGGPQGYRNNSGEQSHLPPEIERLHWHWGAFFFPILWTKKHGLTTMAAMLAGGLLCLRLLRFVFAIINPLIFLGICVFYGVAYFGLQVYLGLNGHKIGWRNRHFPGGVEEYFKVQNAWMWWGFGINITLGVVLPVLLTLGVIGAGLSHAHAGGSYNSGSYNSGSYNSGSYNSGSFGSPSNSVPVDNSGSSSSSGQ